MLLNLYQLFWPLEKIILKIEFQKFNLRLSILLFTESKQLLE